MALLYRVTHRPWHSASIGERFALEAISMVMWPLQDDERMTVLLNLLAAHLDRITATDDEVDAIIDVVRMQMKLRASLEQ